MKSDEASQVQPADEGRLDRVVGRPVTERDDSAEHGLLERAAFAAGLVVESWIAWGGAWVYRREAPANDDGEFPIFKWAPLDDDGDALRLAVTLGIRCEPMASYCVTYAGSVCAQQFSERSGEDRNAAMRRAIVRAAAALANRKPPNARVQPP